MLIFFRVDSGKIIGAGHLVRCRNLAIEIRKYLIDQGKTDINIFFLCRPYDGNCCYILANDNIKVCWLEKETEELRLGVTSSWLGKSISEDVQECIDVINHVKIDLMVVDHYGINLKWESLIQSNCDIEKFMVIGDDNLPHHADYFLNHSIPYECFTIDDLKKLNRVKDLHEIVERPLKLLGPNYALINSYFFELRKMIGYDKLIRNKISRIQISFGGSDPTNETIRVLEFMINYGFIGKYDFDVILGFNFQNKDLLQIMTFSYPNVKIYQGIDQYQMANLLANANLCIGGGGVSMYERCCLGCPSIIISVAQNQIFNTMQLKSLGVIHYLGEAGKWSSENFIQSLVNVTNDLPKISEKCLQILPENTYSQICSLILDVF